MTEICVQIDGKLEDIKKSALDKGFVFSESYNNFDTYYSTISEEDLKTVPYKKLLDNSIIVRNIVGENCDIKNIVYKKKTLDDQGNVIEEIKTKLNIDNIDKAKLIFNSLGLTCWCDFINQNNEYKKGEVVLNIQHVKELGTFIEIEEYESIKNKSDEEKFSILVDVINSLGFPIGTDYSCKKPFMYLQNKLK